MITVPMNPKAPHDPDTGQLIQTDESIRIDAQACELRSRGWSYRQIGNHLGVAAPAAYERVQRAIGRIIDEPAEAARQFELERLDRIWRTTEDIFDAEHVAVSSQGNVVINPDTDVPLIDHDPNLRAALVLLKVQERRAKLLGLDAATKTQVSGGVRYEVVGVDLEQLR